MADRHLLYPPLLPPSPLVHLQRVTDHLALRTSAPLQLRLLSLETSHVRSNWLLLNQVLDLLKGLGHWDIVGLGLPVETSKVVVVPAGTASDFMGLTFPPTAATPVLSLLEGVEITGVKIMPKDWHKGWSHLSNFRPVESCKKRMAFDLRQSQSMIC